jgi:TolA-binding protein
MVRPSRSSRYLDNNKNRLTGFKAIDPYLDLGNGLTVKALAQMTTDLQTQLEDYNSTIVRLDQLKNQIEEQEKAIANLSGKMLATVGLLYGNDSDQYQMAGGKKHKRHRANSQAGTGFSATTFELKTESKNGNGNGNGKKVGAIG